MHQQKYLCQCLVAIPKEFINASERLLSGQEISDSIAMMRIQKQGFLEAHTGRGEPVTVLQQRVAGMLVFNAGMLASDTGLLLPVTGKL
ncbi:MAG: hypothetical protein QM726_13030 [Chitinophagaceae bacterium]